MGTEKAVLIHETWKISLTESAKGALVNNDIDFDTDEVLSTGDEAAHPLYRIYVKEDDVESAKEVLRYADCFDDSPWNPDSSENDFFPKQKWYKNRRLLRRIMWGIIVAVLLIYALIALS